MTAPRGFLILYIRSCCRKPMPHPAFIVANCRKPASLFIRLTPHAAISQMS